MTEQIQGVDNNGPGPILARTGGAYGPGDDGRRAHDRAEFQGLTNGVWACTGHAQVALMDRVMMGGMHMTEQSSRG